MKRTKNTKLLKVQIVTSDDGTDSVCKSKSVSLIAQLRKDNKSTKA